jgi:hypothetical protein
VTTRKCQNCPARQSLSGTIQGCERGFAPPESGPRTVPDGRSWSVQREKRPFDAYARIATLPYRFYDDSRRAFLQAVASAAFDRLENRVQLEIVERVSIPAASRTGQFAHFRVVTPYSQRMWSQNRGCYRVAIYVLGPLHLPLFRPVLYI